MNYIQTLLFCSMVFSQILLGCDNDSNNNSEPAYEICDDGHDNDLDDKIDCFDEDCYDDPACQNLECDQVMVVYGSPPVCEEGYICGLNDNHAPECLPASNFDTGTYYEACGENDECPHGSLCFDNLLYNDLAKICYPLINCSTSCSNFDCPGEAYVDYSLIIDDQNYGLCNEAYDCSVLNQDCPTNFSCYPQGYRDKCLPTGTLIPGQECEATSNCIEGSMCNGFVQNQNPICMKICKLGMASDYCTEGEICHDINHEENIGVCMEPR